MSKTMAKGKGKFKPSRALLTWSVGTCVWLGVLLGVALPAWRHAIDQHAEVQALEKQLADLDSWTVAGLWIEKSLAPRQSVINPQWERLFPVTEAKGDLFLTLARVADHSGVEEFELWELHKDDNDRYSSEQANGASFGDGLTGERLTSYRVQARFQGQYAEVAKFLGGLKTIERAVSVHNLAIQPALGAVHVNLELDIYVSARDES